MFKTLVKSLVMLRAAPIGSEWAGGSRSDSRQAPSSVDARKRRDLLGGRWHSDEQISVFEFTRFLTAPLSTNRQF